MGLNDAWPGEHELVMTDSGLLRGYKKVNHKPVSYFSLVSCCHDMF